MLVRLHIENFALIERADLELGPGLNIITGETGAGKSILIGALQSILSGKAASSSSAALCCRKFSPGNSAWAHELWTEATGLWLNIIASPSATVSCDSLWP